MIFNILEKSMYEQENELLENSLENFFESVKEDYNRLNEIEQIKVENVDPVSETYEPIERKHMDELWRKYID